ncbi:MAG: phosphatase PAP2 family protein [Sphingobacteriaceae bacterium]|nr:phosphatase PAP2 family protein [Sphingobacteriaceae bacterium]
MQLQIRQLLRENKSFYTAYLFFLLSGITALLVMGKESLFLQMNLYHHPWADVVAPWLTHLGDGLFALFFLVVFMLFNYRLAVTALICFVSVLFITQFGKLVLFEDALRPFAYFEAQGMTIRTIEGVKIHSNNSFPSGHSASVFALLSFLALRLTKKQWGLPLLLAAVCISYTRVYIAQHFYGDVLAGSFIGIITVLSITAALDNYYSKHPAVWHQKGLLNP